jgi:hypothetical protein
VAEMSGKDDATPFVGVYWALIVYVFPATAGSVGAMVRTYVPVLKVIHPGRVISPELPSL